jgi:hypothetical protein
MPYFVGLLITDSLKFCILLTKEGMRTTDTTEIRFVRRRAMYGMIDNKHSYSIRDQTARFPYVIDLRLERKQRHVLCRTKGIIGKGTEASSYKVLPLGNNVYNIRKCLYLKRCI